MAPHRVVVLALDGVILPLAGCLTSAAQAGSPNPAPPSGSGAPPETPDPATDSLPAAPPGKGGGRSHWD
jgi:hypothetical protein